MKVTDFEEARLSFGTDEDLIAVELPAPLNTAAKNFDIKWLLQVSNLTQT